MIRDRDEKIKVMLFTCSLEIGGTQRNIINIAEHLDKSRFDASICCLFSGGVLAEQANQIGIPIREMRFISGTDPLFYCKMVKLLREQQIDILHCFGYPAIYYSVLAAGFISLPIVITTIQDWDVWKTWPHRFLDKIVRERADLIISDGEGARHFAIKQMNISENKIITIYDGVNPDELQPSRDLSRKRRELNLVSTKPIVAVIARLDDAKKGQSDFLKAVAIILKTYPDAQFMLVGGGEDEGMLKNLAAQIGIKDKVIFTGMRTDLADMIDIADIIVIPSRWESVPKILLEAMALSKPVIATAVGDIAEILVDGITGILVPPKQPEALARAILHLLGNSSLRNELGKQGYKRVIDGGLLIQNSVQKLEDIYIELAHLQMGKRGKGIAALYNTAEKEKRQAPLSESYYCQQNLPRKSGLPSFLLGLAILYISNLSFAMRVNLRNFFRKLSN